MCIVCKAASRRALPHGLLIAGHFRVVQLTGRARDRGPRRIASPEADAGSGVAMPSEGGCLSCGADPAS